MIGIQGNEVRCARGCVGIHQPIVPYDLDDLAGVGGSRSITSKGECIVLDGDEGSWVGLARGNHVRTITARRHGVVGNEGIGGTVADCHTSRCRWGGWSGDNETIYFVMRANREAEHINRVTWIDVDSSVCSY